MKKLVGIALALAGITALFKDAVVSTFSSADTGLKQNQDSQEADANALVQNVDTDSFQNKFPLLAGTSFTTSTK